MAALELLRNLQEADRPATREEQQVLARWSGWGALPAIFNARPARPAYDSDDEHERALARWESLAETRGRVRELLTPAEWDSARLNTVTAFYTDAALVQTIWGAVRDLGFDGGAVLEPGSGSGNFIGHAPQDTTVPVHMTGVELDPVTAGLSQYLYPDAEITNSALEDLRLPDAYFAAAVGNVPFGSFKPYDAQLSPNREFSIHDLAVLKALTAVRPGGVVALVTSRYTLDSQDDTARRRLYELGDLLGAARLPARTHRAAAGTDVVTDVLFLRRRPDTEAPGDDSWLHSVERVLPGRDEPLHVNAYFDAHPEHVLGDLRARLGQYGPEITVTGPADQVAGLLREAARSITDTAREQGRTVPAELTAPRPQLIPARNAPDGALRVDETGAITIAEAGYFIPLEVHPEQRDKLIQLVGLKQQVRALYDAEAATAGIGETEELNGMRTELRTAYRVYRKKNASLAKPRQARTFTPKGAAEQAQAQGLASVPAHWKHHTAFAYIDDDPEAALLFGLEEWDDATKKATEQKVLHARVLEPRLLSEHAETPEDAVTLALEHDGGDLHISRVARLLGVDEETAVQRIGHLAFRDPDRNGAWEPRHRYLSGDVRHKLKTARAAAAEDLSYAGNVAALEQIQPADLAPSEIKAKTGATWIPIDVYNDFLKELGFTDASVAHAGGTVWEVKGAHNGDLARSEWGTEERSTRQLFEALLRQTESTIRIAWRDDEGHVHVDQEATDAAREKARLLAEAFEDWVWTDESRAQRLAGIYNERFNNLVLPEHDQAPLTLPGVVTDWGMRPHQNAAIRRILSEPTALLAHVVGAGKTATMVGGAMELRRTGLASKPGIVVPNHMLKQFGREFRQLYPNANILAISASDLGRSRRAKFLARMASGDWDAVILTHEAFNRMPLRPQTIQHYMDTEISQLRAQIDLAAEAGMDSRTVKQVETALANATARLNQQMDKATEDGGVTFEDTGVDYLFFDEAHEYKNLRTISAIPGAEIEGSAKATKLHMVLDHLREHTGSGRVATLATGTPVANSVTEAYVLMRYLAPDLLDRLDVAAFDNWAANFGEVVSALEPDPKGGGYRYKARFSRFFNVPELMSGYRTFADVQMAEDLKLPTPAVREEKEGQRGETVLIPATRAQREFIKSLKNAPWINKPGGILKALGEGLRASLDMRLVGGQEEEGSKLSYAAEKIVEVWEETKDTVYPVSKDDPTPQETPGGLQLVFLDEGTPGGGAKHGMNLYADLRDQLTDQGIPREQVRFIHEAHTDQKKETLFADCRAGKVAVLIGSTQKMGTGTNVQARAVALHHLSYPWRPADMAQRDGRIERQGNLNVPAIPGTPDDVRILYYVTERTFDEFRLNTLARKAKFIGQIQRRNFAEREIEDISADAMNLGLLTALASGDPAVLQHAEAAAERVRLTGLARAWDRAQDKRAMQIGGARDFIRRAEPALEAMRAALPQRRPTTGDAFAMKIGETTYRKKDEAGAALGARMAGLARDQSLRPGERIPVGTLGALDFHAEISFDHKGARQLKLRFGWGHVVPDGHRDDRAQWPTAKVTEDSGRGAVQALENFLNRLERDTDTLAQELQRQHARSVEITGNLQSKDDNPYRALARSKEREELLLGKLVILNEKESELAERISGGAEQPSDEVEVPEELAALRSEIDDLAQRIAAEHSLQNDVQAATSYASTGPSPAESETVADARPEPEIAPDAKAGQLGLFAPAVSNEPDHPSPSAVAKEQPSQPRTRPAPATPPSGNEAGEKSGLASPPNAGTGSAADPTNVPTPEETTAPRVRTEPNPAADPDQQERRVPRTSLVPSEESPTAQPADQHPDPLGPAGDLQRDQEEYARTGRVPGPYFSLEEWLGHGADAARTLREEYLEALVTEDAQRAAAPAPQPSELRPPAAAPDPSEEPASDADASGAAENETSAAGRVESADPVVTARPASASNESDQQRDDVPETGEPPLPAPAPEPPLPPTTSDRTEEAPMATPTADPSTATAADSVRSAAEASRVSQPPVPAPPAASPAPLEERVRTNAEAATPEAQRELPLWTGNDLPDGAGWTARDGVLYDGYGAPTWKLKTPTGAPNPTQVPVVPPAPVAVSSEAGSTDPGNAYDPADLWAADLIEPVGLPEAFERVEEAWADIVPPDLGTAQDLRTAVDNDLRTLEQQWRRTVLGSQVAPAAAASASATDARQAAAAVNTALQEADRHAPALKDSPQWQQLQTVRGAAAHLWDVIKEKAGPYFERLADDARVQGFWRTVSARSCETIARWAQAGADRLRSGAKRPDLPTAEALLKVSDTALAYSSPRDERPDAATVAAAQDQNAAEIRQLRSTLRSNAPLPYATRDDAVEASREIAQAFQDWAGTDMGKEFGASTHRRVAEFREAWQQLPSSELPGGPGPAAGPYSAVAEHAQGIVERAQAQPGRFNPADLAALQTVADLAEHHGGRLAATLPPGLTGPATPAAAVQQSAPRPAVATPGPVARPGAPRLSA
ncbi:DEAD/DEAH box helicase family protein [Streptomyces sp. NPDC056231]|uniref:DEAD/DEAH box helicase family protein n=1 Tax=Streptomyces sp. NPDC056231 TaxID=3345755 RepID=UPI003AB02C01